MRWSPPDEHSLPSESSLVPMDADDSDGLPPDPPGELCSVAAAEPLASGGRPDLDMALDIFRCKRDSTPPPSSRGKTAIIDSYTLNLNNFTKKSIKLRSQ